MIPEQTIKYAMLMSDPEFQKLLKSLLTSPVRNAFYATEAGLMVGLFLFRIWMGPKHQTLWGRAFFQLWTLIAFTGLSSYVVPRFWYGPDFDRLLAMIRPVLPPTLIPYWPWG